MEPNRHFIIGLYTDEDVLVQAVRTLRGKGVKIHEVYSPFPVHGLDEALGYRRTRLPIAAFLFGLVGTILAVFAQVAMMGFDWPMIIGGKNYVSLPPFVPVIFEFTVLLSALGMVGTFFVVSNMKPYKWPRQFDIRSTDDKHVLAVDIEVNMLDKEMIRNLMKENGAIEINDKNF